MFVMSRIRAFDSVFEALEYAFIGKDEIACAHCWIFIYRLKHGRYPTNSEIASRKL